MNDISTGTISNSAQMCALLLIVPVLMWFINGLKNYFLSRHF